MLVQFSIRNFKVFKEEVKLTLFASNYDKTTREQENVFEVPKFGLRLLKSAVIYGANASGKTKLIDAVHFMKTFILKSSKESQQGELIEAEPFRLNTVTVGQPSMFEIVFIHEDEMYRYGFEATPQEVVSEWLYHRPNTKEVEIFFREGQNFTVHTKSFKKGNLLVKENMVRNNALMLSVAAQFNDTVAKSVLSWFEKFHQLSGLHEDGYMGYSMTRVEDSKNKIVSLLKVADIGIEDISVKKMDTNNLPQAMPDQLKEIIKKRMEEDKSVEFMEGVNTIHFVYDENNRNKGFVEFDLSEDESSGTVKFFALTGPILKALEFGEVLVIDEMDSKIHPNLVHKLVSLFNSNETNPNHAQLIFNTHDTNLLGSNLFRRDQIWFVEKDRYGAALLYSLASFKTDEGGRKTDNFEENYLQGRYGGVPLLGDFTQIFHPEVG
jgi:AAA15 family ATPase/GTPase